MIYDNLEIGHKYYIIANGLKIIDEIIIVEKDYFLVDRQVIYPNPFSSGCQTINQFVDKIKR